MESNKIIDDRQAMTVTIDNHKYPLKVKRTDEEKFRIAVQTINEKIKQYKQKFNVNGRSDYDFLAFVTIDLVANYIGNENGDKELLSEIRIMSSEIDDYIQKSQAL